MKLKFHIPIYKNTKQMLKGKYNQQKPSPWATTREITFLQQVITTKKREMKTNCQLRDSEANL